MQKTREIKIFLTQQECDYIKKHSRPDLTLGQNIEAIIRNCLKAYTHAQEPVKAGIFGRLSKLLKRG